MTNFQSGVVVLLLFSNLSSSLSQLDSTSFYSNYRSRRAAIDAGSSNRSIVENAECHEARQLCSHLKYDDNLSVLECINSLKESQLETIPQKCQHIIWQYTRHLLRMPYLNGQLLSNFCIHQYQKLSSCETAESALNCLLDKVEESKLPDQCGNIIRRVYQAQFPDFFMQNEFFAACDEDIEGFECGRLNLNHAKASQMETMSCLKKKGGNKISGTCREFLENIPQQQVDSKVFDVCKNDLKKLCPQEYPESSNAMKCLLEQRFNPLLSSRCGKQLEKRENDIARDYRTSHSLAKACKDDIKNNHCRRGVSEDKQVRLAQILLCLESVMKNGTKINIECREEINEHRKMLMMDFQLSPEILSDCSDDIPKFCSEVEKIGGEVIHCLMDNARVKKRNNKRVSVQCQRSVEKLVKITDVGEDWRVDPVLRVACKPVVDIACRDTIGGEARVMSCLMEHIGTPVMRADCEQALLLIQYFVARDFKLDPELYKNCREDAIKYCRAKKTWDDYGNGQMDPERGPLVLPCLHRIAYNDDGKLSLHQNCFNEVKRVMRQRAASVDLIPEVEDFCIEDLSLFCFDKTKRGAEMECLQVNLEKLQPRCKEAVTAYTEEEAAHVELNPVIMSVCMEAMKVHCEHIINGNGGDMMDCLISHKNDADLRQDLKCRAAIEHFQIVSLKNYHFTYKFKEACKPHVIRFCTSSTTKNEVVSCLSEVMRNDTIRGQRHSIPKECRQQVKAQLYQQRESVALDPKLANACKKELDELCADEKGPGQAIECLALNTASLGKSCHHVVFLIKKSELEDSETDYTLVNTCKEMIYKFCARTDSMQLLDCLKIYKDEPSFDSRCHLVVVNRMIEQNTDYRFNPDLQLACGKNIDKYCSDIVTKARPNEELNGKVVQCLKIKFRESRLDPNCEKEMIKILQEQALNYKLNPLLQNFCKSEIEVLCKPNVRKEEHGLIEECLKTAFLNQKIVRRECKIEVATLIAEAKADIHVDPILEDACTVDLLRYCSNVRSGNGRKLNCLQVILQDQSKAMEIDCKDKLKRRMEMFKNADTVLAQPPENFNQLVNQVVTSPAKKFFLVILMSAVGMVFMIGIFLGRATKQAINTKNK